MQNSQFLLYNESNNKWLSVDTNETGKFYDYIPSGDWVMIISDQVYENETYVYRAPVTINEDSTVRTGLTIAMEESVEIMLTLKQELTGTNLTDIRITAVSNDGFGNVTLEPSNSSGVVVDDIMPGSWNLYLDKEIDDMRWSIDSDSYTLETNGLSELDLGEIIVNTEVSIGGSIYWDFNENGDADTTELITEANVTVVSSDGSIQFNLQTDSDGLWSQLVPIQDTYNVTVEKKDTQQVITRLMKLMV